MKTLLLTLAIMAALIRSSYAVEYVTLLPDENASKAPESPVEFVFNAAYHVELTTGRKYFGGQPTLTDNPPVGCKLLGLGGKQRLE
jgi:hypothetical protein